MELFIETNDVRTPVNTLWEKFSFFVSNTLKINMFQTKCHLLDTANHGLPVIAKSCLERKKKLYQKAKKSKLSIDWDK